MEKSQEKDTKEQTNIKKSVFEDIKKSYLYSKKEVSNEKLISIISPKRSDQNRCET
jgi:hypothetical protein